MVRKFSQSASLKKGHQTYQENKERYNRTFLERRQMNISHHNQDKQENKSLLRNGIPKHTLHASFAFSYFNAIWARR